MLYTCNLCNIVHQFLKIKEDKSQVKKAETKDHTLHNSIPMKYSEQENP